MKRGHIRYAMGWIRSIDLVDGHGAAVGVRHNRGPPEGSPLSGLWILVVTLPRAEGLGWG